MSYDDRFNPNVKSILRNNIDCVIYLGSGAPYLSSDVVFGNLMAYEFSNGI